MENKIAIVRIRGNMHMRPEIKTALQKLRLYRKNTCSVWELKPGIMGMARKVKDYTAYGYIKEEAFKQLVEKRGEIYKGDAEDKNKYFVFGNKKYKKFFRLHPPRKGFENKGTKFTYKQGGALGFRDKMDDLIMRMI